VPRRRCLPLALLATVALAAPAHAATTLQVNTESDHAVDGSCDMSPDCTLREAVQYSSAGDTIEVPDGTYHLGSELSVTHSLTIQGAGLAATTITGDDSTRLIHIQLGGGAQVLRGLQLTAGKDTSAGVGGAIFDEAGTGLKLDQTRVNDNHVDAPLPNATEEGGGGIFSAGSVEVDGGMIDGNRLTLDASGFLNTSGGAAIWAAGTVTLRDTELHNNVSELHANPTSAGTFTENGGGAVYANGGNVTITRTTIAGNTTQLDSGMGTPMDVGGGGVYMNGGDLTATNSTFVSDAANINVLVIDNGGGALYSHGGAATLTNVTVAESSTAGGTGGGVYREGGTVTARNTILAGNTSAPGTPDNCHGGVTSTGHNLESADTCGLNGPGDVKNRDPKLGPLQSNGGPARTRALLPDSPAIGAADNSGCPATDERGVARPKGAVCDIGAYEAEVPSALTGPATKRAYGSATLTGTVDPDGHATSYVFQYGRTATYGSTTSATAAGAGVGPVPASLRVKRLKPKTTYHYRLVATNSSGTEIGVDRRFKTVNPGRNPFRLPSVKKCLAKRKVGIRPRRPAGTRVVHVVAFINKKKRLDRKRKSIKRVTVKLPAKDFSLRISATYDDGARVVRKLKYHRC
jgi:hypothetical protein